MSLLTLHRRRDCQLSITIYQSGGTAYTWVANDVIRIKIGREGSTPLVDLSSKAASANGSTVSKSNPCILQLRAADINLLARGVYQFEIAVVDDSDSDKIKHVESHVVNVMDTQTGGVSI